MNKVKSLEEYNLLLIKEKEQLEEDTILMRERQRDHLLEILGGEEQWHVKEEKAKEEDK